MRFTDSHCHLTMADADAALARARENRSQRQPGAHHVGERRVGEIVPRGDVPRFGCRHLEHTRDLYRASKIRAWHGVL